ncbi:helix-turn-helix domain-containing protein [Streptomyces sp. DR7-3]|uniref:AraC family transcriptional regulator n=1 Tax=Streptomyces malaysiensis TaxID=92644 RepID=UPI002042CD10|nr:helix-turn-helix domain-containing protein [Streptomyces sp. DR7-3]MCM3811923.1 helix-turn-helix domain-containing protein [Streptomyces sp. DR7-3]
MSSQEFVRAGAGLGLGLGLGEMVVTAVGYRSQGAPPTLHRGLPSPYLTVIFSLDGPVISGGTPEQARGPGAARTEIVVGGLHQRPAYIVQPGREAGVQLAVHPLAARTLLGLPAGALASDLVTPGADVLGKRATEVWERLCEQRAWGDRFATLGTYLRERAAEGEDGTPVRSEVAEAWAWLARHRGAGTLKGLAEHVSLGPRRLTSVFRAETGLSPKQAARLMRFQHARNTVVRAVAAGRAPDLARTATDCGYFDHSHLVRDFRQYTGVSPTAWLAEECRNIQAGGHLYGEE